MYIIGIGTANPATRYSQHDCYQALAESRIYKDLSKRSRALLKKVLNGRSGIDARYLSLDPLEEFTQFHPDALHERFLRHAPDLAATAVQRALDDAGVPPADVDALVVSTCTGYLCPGLSSYVAGRLSLRSGIVALDLVGHGCSASLPNLQTGEALLALNGRCRTVVSVCVEVCSAAFYLDDDPGVLISACLFGDGAAALVLQPAPQPGKRELEWCDCNSIVMPEQRDTLRFETRNGMLRNILTPAVPELAASSARNVLFEVLERHDLKQDDISTWLWHSAGRDVLDAIRDHIDLDERGLQWSRSVLQEFGNMSSPSVLFALHSAMRSDAPSGWWWLAAFGAGFSSHGALLRAGKPL